jgi:hypothetical protein
MDDQRLESKLDKIGEDIGVIKVTLGEQHISLAEHVRRTNLLEQQIEPIKKHVAVVNAMGQVVLAILASGILWEAGKWLLSLK